MLFIYSSKNQNLILNMKNDYTLERTFFTQIKWVNPQSSLFETRISFLIYNLEPNLIK